MEGISFVSIPIGDIGRGGSLKNMPPATTVEFFIVGERPNTGDSKSFSLVFSDNSFSLGSKSSSSLEVEFST